MVPDEPTGATFYFVPLKCHLTMCTFIHYTPRLCGEDEVAGLVLQIQLKVNDSLCLLHDQQYVLQDYLHIRFCNLSDVSIVRDSSKEVIETDMAAMIMIGQVKGLAFVFPCSASTSTDENALYFQSKAIEFWFSVSMYFDSADSILHFGARASMKVSHHHASQSLFVTVFLPSSGRNYRESGRSSSIY